MKHRPVAVRIGLGIWLSSLVFLVLAWLLFAAGRAARADMPLYPYWMEITINVPIHCIVGAVITWHQPAHRIGWLFTGAAWIASLQLLTGQYATTGLANVPFLLSGSVVAAWLSLQLQSLFALTLLLLLTLFPTGHLPSRRWQVVPWCLIAGVFLFSFVDGFASRPLSDFGVPNPFGWVWLNDWLIQMDAIAIGLLLAGIAGAILLLLSRLIRARGQEQQQVKLFVYVAVMGIVVMLATTILPESFTDGFFGNLLWAVVPGSLPVAAALAVLRYGLYDIDLIIRRTLVYSLLTTVLALIFFGSVTLMQSLFSAISGQQSAIATVLSTLLIAALFTPLRRRVQEVIDRRFFRQKYDAQQVLAQFAVTARDETDLRKLTADLVNVVHETLHPDQVTVWLRNQERR